MPLLNFCNQNFHFYFSMPGWLLAELVLKATILKIFDLPVVDNYGILVEPVEHTDFKVNTLSLHPYRYIYGTG